ncbi:Uncharacterised protein [Neisseria lactamica]|nr:Uncharacterised protein [Neisseria lactamica]
MQLFCNTYRGAPAYPPSSQTCRHQSRNILNYIGLHEIPLTGNGAAKPFYRIYHSTGGKTFHSNLFSHLHTVAIPYFVVHNYAKFSNEFSTWFVVMVDNDRFTLI